MSSSLFGKALHLIHRSIYVYTSFFSRVGLNKFLSIQADEINKDLDNYSKVLNVGSGGFVAGSVNKIKSNCVLNIDLDPDRHPDMVVDVCDMKQFSDGEFDVVVMSEVLEHVKTPHLAIQEIYRVLREGGKLILTAPFLFEMHDRPHDYYRFTKHGLEYLLGDFSQVDIESRNNYFDVVVVLGMRLFLSEKLSDKAIATIFIIIISCLYPAIWVINQLVKSDAATTGYMVHCIK